jgi:hypothetical protein
MYQLQGLRGVEPGNEIVLYDEPEGIENEEE